jgi:hypothetical protein
MPVLQELDWSPKWVSHLGCLKGCLDYLDATVTDAWLYGASAHAFIINLSDDLCPSGPTAWRYDMMFGLLRNAGCSVRGVHGSRDERTLRESRERAWALVRSSIDGGLPCYGWELEQPEFYVVAGYEGDGYLFTGPMTDGLSGPLPYDRLGESGIGVVEMYAVEAVPPADERRTVREALEAALRHAREPGRWRFEPYRTGPEAFDTWANALDSGRAVSVGAAYNAAVWLECRTFAVEFLKEAKERIGGDAAPLWDEAIARYEAVCRALETVQELYPFRPGLGEERLEPSETTAVAVEALRRARDAEVAGLEALGHLVEEPIV